MRAVVYHGAKDLRVETIPVPAIGKHELLVRVAACGVCPTDIKKIHYGTVTPPRVFGHETAGTIVRVGPSVTGFKLGERVALHHHVPCLKCHFCRHRAFAQCARYKQTGITAGFEPAGGGYGEYVRVMPFVLPGVVKIPRGNTFLEGAMLEPVNTVLKAVERLAILPGDTVLVAGQGPIGLMFTRLLTLRRAKVIATDLLETRLRLADSLGASCALKVESAEQSRSEATAANRRRKGQNQVRGLLSGISLADVVDRATAGRGLDAAVIAVPSERVMVEAQALVRGGGRVLLFSHTKRGDLAELDLASICVDEKDLIGSYSADFLLQTEVARLVFSRRLDVRQLVTHQFPLEQTAAAVDLAAHPTSESLKVVVTQSANGLGRAAAL